MNRNSLMEMSGRLMHVVQRFTLNGHDDNPMMQVLHLDGMNSESRKAVERVQAYGFSSAPLPRDQQQAQQTPQQAPQPGSGGVGGNGEPMKGPAAEGICLYVGGQRNHPVCIAMDDRRHRPMGLKPGENAQYDDLGQMTLLRRTGLFLLSLDDEQQQGSSGSASTRDSSGGGSGSSGGTQRMVSLRHVEKKKQPRGTADKAETHDAGGLAAGAAQQAAQVKQSQQDFKHEGESVNHEIRVNKGRIEFFTGDKSVGHYDKQSNTWNLQENSGKVSCQVDGKHAHIKFGDNSIWIDGGGCWTSKPITQRSDTEGGAGANEDTSKTLGQQSKGLAAGVGSAASGLGGLAGGLGSLAGGLGGLGALAGNLGALGGSLNGLVGGLSGIAGSLGSLGGALSGIAGLGGALSGLNSGLGLLSGAMSGMSGGLAGLNLGGLTGLVNGIGGMTGGLSNFGGGIGGILSSVTGLTSNMSGMVGSLSGLSNIGAIIGGLSSLSSGLGSISGIANVVTNIGAIAGNLSGQSGSLGNLAPIVSAVTVGQMGQLPDDLNTVKAAVDGLIGQLQA